MDASYLHFFHLKEYPWGLSADPRYFWCSHSVSRDLERLQRGMEFRAGCLLVTGVPGVGKTMVCRALEAGLREEGVRHRVVWMLPSQGLTPRAVLVQVATALGIKPVPRDRTALVQAIYAGLSALHAQGEGFTLVADEAQLLPREALLELKLLTNLEAPDKLANVILAGQPSLLRRLRRPGLASLASRIAVKVHLGELGREEVASYLRHRVQAAGLNEMPFSREAVVALSKMSGGNPRRLNLLADLAMAEAARRRERVITGDAAAKAVVP